MGYTNSSYPSRITSSEALVPAQTYQSGTISSSDVIKVMVQIQLNVNNTEYAVPPSPVSNINVSLMPINYESTMDTSAFYTKTISISGLAGTKSVSFDTTGIPAYKLQIQNSNDWGVYITTRLSEAKVN
jgi:hypothetical protein